MVEILVTSLISGCKNHAKGKLMVHTTKGEAA